MPSVQDSLPLSDDEFLLSFEAQSLPREQWTHRAHVKVAYLYLTRLSFDDALMRVRSGVQAFNSAKGIVDSPTGGYHETMTCAWLHLVHTTLCQSGKATSAEAFLDEHPQLTQKRILLLFYSRDRIMSVDAKRTFIEPDLAPLPRPVNGNAVR